MPGIPITPIMKEPSQFQKDRSAQLLVRLDELRHSLRNVDPEELARRVGSEYEAFPGGQGEFRLPLWDQPVIVTYPELVAQDLAGSTLNPLLQAMLVYHFFTTDGAALADRYIAFSELPDGRFYASAFQGYTGEEIRRSLGDNQQGFMQAAHSIGGIPYSLGDAAFTFRLLPRVTLLAVFWSGDEEFPCTYQVLFDAAAPHHLPTDACAIAGSLLTRRLIAASG